MRGSIVSMYRRAAVAGGAVALAALALGAPPAAAQGSSAQHAIDLAVGGLGGERALRQLSSFRLRATGRMGLLDEAPQPGDAVSRASTFRVTLDYDMRAAGDRLRADSVRTSFGVTRQVSEVIVGRRGFIAGQDANFAPPQEAAMTGDRLAAIMREQRLLNPHLYVRRLLARPGLARVAGSRRVGGRRHHVLVVSGDVAPVRLLVAARTGRIARLTTVDHNYLRGDVRTVVEYRGWRRAAGGGVRFPRRVSLAQDGQVLRVESRSAMRTNQRIAAARFRFPPGVNPTLDRALADRGARTTEWIMGFAHAGFPTDGAATEIVPRVIAPGSTLLQGSTHQTLIVEQQDGIVVVEGVLHEFRAEAIIDFVERTHPGKPIRYVTASHHHVDHAGGMRPFVALGARPVVHEAAVPFLEREFADRRSRLIRDRLDRSDATADILAVPATGTITLPDPLRPVTLLAERTDHAATTILVHVPREGVLFVNGDTYTPALPPEAPALTLDQTIRAAGLGVDWIVGAHGDVISYPDFLRAIGRR